MEIVGIAAVDANNLIGADDSLPWPSIEADKRQYRELVADAPVILGRHTFELMQADLPGRWQIVITRDVEYHTPVESAIVAHSKDEAITRAKELTYTTVYVLGGEAIYDLFLPVMDRLRLSRIKGSYSGTHYFPDLDLQKWSLERTRAYPDFTIEFWTRK